MQFQSVGASTQLQSISQMPNGIKRETLELATSGGGPVPQLPVKGSSRERPAQLVYSVVRHVE